MTGKRALDLALTLAALPVAIPLALVVALLVRWRLGAPVLFRQLRPGLNGEIFALRKFRTMTDRRDAAGELLPDDQRLTRFGAFLRSTSLDELPSLYNVLKGEMSLVGPRPLLTEYLPLYSPEQSRRHEVPPGLTGWAQVSGRNNLPWKDKLALDVWYVDNRSLALDLRIIVMTLVKVLRRDDIAQEGHVTAPRFTGSD